MYTFQKPKATATTTAYGSHSLLIIAIPPINRPTGMYTPLMYCGANGPEGADMSAEFPQAVMVKLRVCCLN
jgi:hypothetical protein